uniref:Disease resistance protein At4g27190-like leucine-rich repeats domain-containing protein n=1 Tax=Nelumbo nucifera TaxID=4432 RepID=A0A822Z9A1_NELNU|nr:TPA_asm: hypothetical protein HUJ06_013959 [Nelumbo nucifera]
MLEELCIKALDNKVDWEKETSREITSDASSSFAEITCLPNLTALDVSMPEANCLPQHVNTLPNWTRFHIHIGFSFIFDDDIPIKLKISRSMTLCNTEISTLPNWFKRVVLSKAEALLFYNVSNQDVRKLFVESDFQLYLSKCDLKILVVRYCDGIKSLLNVMELDSESKEIALMDNLEELHLKKLENFRRICHGQLPNGSFKKLRILRINKCDKLRSLLSPSLARSLSQLEEIEIKDCKVLKEIIAKDAEMVQVEEKIVFPQLKIIKLCYLKNITSFYLGSAPIECPSLEQVKVYECQKMKVFASRLQNTPEPKLIEGGDGDLKWYERDVNNAMQFQHEFLRIWRLFCRLVKPLRNHLREKEEGIKNQLDKLKKDWLADAELVTLSSLRDKEALNAERWSTAESWVDEVEHHLIRIGLLRPEEIPNMQFFRTMELLYQLIRPLVHFVGLRYHKLQELIQELSKLKERWRKDPQLRKLVSSSSSVGEPTSSIRWKIAERWKGDFERHLGSSGLLPVVGCTTERIRKFFQVMKLFVKMDPLDNYLNWRLGWDPKLKQMVKNCSKELEHHWVMDPELMTLISSPKEGLREKKKNIAERWRDEFKHQVISLGLLPDGDTPEHIKEVSHQLAQI